MPGSGWLEEFFIGKGWLFAEVMRRMLERGVEEARLLAGLLERHGVPRGSRVVELGCGIGRVAVPLAGEGYRVTCLDLSSAYVDEARRRAAEAGVADRFEAVAADAWRVDEALEGPFDAAFMIWTTLLGYKGGAEADMELLRRVARVVRPGGLLLILRQAHRDLVVADLATCPARVKVGDHGDLVVFESPEFDPIASVVRNTWRYYRRLGDGTLKLLGEAGFELRIYTATEVVEIARRAGWEIEAVYGSLDGSPFNPTNTSLNLVARKPAGDPAGREGGSEGGP